MLAFEYRNYVDISVLVTILAILNRFQHTEVKTGILLNKVQNQADYKSICDHNSCTTCMILSNEPEIIYLTKTSLTDTLSCPQKNLCQQHLSFLTTSAGFDGFLSSKTFCNLFAVLRIKMISSLLSSFCGRYSTRYNCPDKRFLKVP